jgi:hypothetical protein
MILSFIFGTSFKSSLSKMSEISEIPRNIWDKMVDFKREVRTEETLIRV